MSIKEKKYDIPLPKQSSYTGKGFTVGIGMGVFDPADECDCLGVWQGQMEYYYKSWLSAGVEVRFFGGDVNSDYSILYQRYRAFLKTHLAFSSFSFYLSPIVGLENTDISELREEWKNRKNEKFYEDSLDMEESNCEKIFRLDGFNFGLEGGLGVLLSKYVGGYWGVLYERNFRESRLLTLTPGLGFNLRSIWNWADKNTYSLWINFDVGFQRYFNRGVKDWSRSYIVGLVLGI